MSNQAAVIRVAESLIPLPPEAFPKNLSRTVREDSPETMFPILAYDGQNILPTPWGYRSYFATNEKLLKDSVARLLSNVRCENIFWYQSAQLDNVLVALASDGIYITNTDIDTDWIKVVDLAASDTNPLVRKQWSYCTINNITFMYLQGTSAFYGLVDVARYAEAATPTIITGATVSQVAINWNVGVLSYTPTFLNMAGQLGIFKAGNRLGFWDSDTSVSWSSALYVEDFTPSVTTLAGFSKFVDVIGSITRICQHGDGFIIYCTRAIVGVSNDINEKSKFSGRAILSNVGVLFDRQIAVAQPDSLHYVLTSSGLYTITNFNPEVIATDILDGLVEANNYLSLDFVDGRYLFINTINGWESSVIEVEAETNEDFDGNKYVFPPVVYPNPEDTSDLVGSYLAGQNQLIQDAFEDFEPVDSPPHELPEDKVLIPCYDLKKFVSTWADTTYTPNDKGTELLDSKVAFGLTYLLEDLYTDPLITVNAISSENIMPGDFAGDELVAKLNECIEAVSAQLEYQNLWQADNGTSREYNFLVGAGGFDSPRVTWEKQLIERVVRPNCISLEDLKVEANECRQHLYLSQDRLMETLVYLEGYEEFVGGLVSFYQEPVGIGTSISSGSVLIPEYSYGVAKLTKPVLDAMHASGDAVALNAGLHNLGTRQLVSIYATYEPLIPDDNLFQATENVRTTNTLYSASGRPNDVANEVWLSTAKSMGTRFEDIPFEDSVSPYPAGYVNDGIRPIKFTIPGFLEMTWNVSAEPFPDTLYIKADDVNNPGKSAWFRLFMLAPDNTVSHETASAIAAALAVPHTKGISINSGTGTPKVLAKFTTTCEMNLLPNFPAKLTVFDMQLSGFGYYPSGGFSFRKTHNRHSSTSCPVPSVSFGAKLPVLPTITPPDYDIKDQVTPPYQWEYPPFINLPPNYWLTKKGSAAPLFPTSIRSLVYDTQLEKWGISNMLFKAISSISPVNRSDKTITPKHDYGMLAAILAPDGSVAIVSPNNTASEITYGKLGQYRLGKTKMAYLKFHFKEKFTGTLIVETSLDGRTVAPELTKAADFTDVLSARFPFTLTGEWFNMKVRGSFTLCHIEAFIEGRSRR